MGRSQCNISKSLSLDAAKKHYHPLLSTTISLSKRLPEVPPNTLLAMREAALVIIKSPMLAEGGECATIRDDCLPDGKNGQC